jgi:hypothetical protein
MDNLFRNLNLQHRAGLCLTLVAAGTILLSAKPSQMTWMAAKAVGVVLIGLGITWFIPSLEGAAGLVSSSLAVCVGLSLAILPVWRDWESYHAALQKFQAAKVALAAVGAERKAALPSGIDWDSISCEFEAGEALQRGFASDFDNEVEDEMYCTSPEATPPFLLKTCIASHPVSGAGGYTLAAFGLLGIFSLIRRPSKRKAQAKTETMP